MSWCKEGCAYFLRSIYRISPYMNTFVGLSRLKKDGGTRHSVLHTMQINYNAENHLFIFFVNPVNLNKINKFFLNSRRDSLLLLAQV